jgi:hypothetical protein
LGESEWKREAFLMPSTKIISKGFKRFFPYETLEDLALRSLSPEMYLLPARLDRQVKKLVYIEHTPQCWPIYN